MKVAYAKLLACAALSSIACHENPNIVSAIVCGFFVILTMVVTAAIVGAVLRPTAG